jgi:hypothetical protein
MGYGVAMRTRSYRHMSAEERKTVSLGLAHGIGVGAGLQHRESRVGPQYDEGPNLSGLHGTHGGNRSGLSAAGISELFRHVLDTRIHTGRRNCRNPRF